MGPNITKALFHHGLPYCPLMAIHLVECAMSCSNPPHLWLHPTCAHAWLMVLNPEGVFIVCHSAWHGSSLLTHLYKKVCHCCQNCGQMDVSLRGPPLASCCLCKGKMQVNQLGGPGLAIKPIINHTLSRWGLPKRLKLIRPLAPR